jgi:hypothetical protein
MLCVKNFLLYPQRFGANSRASTGAVVTSGRNAVNDEIIGRHQLPDEDHSLCIDKITETATVFENGRLAESAHQRSYAVSRRALCLTKN